MDLDKAIFGRRAVRDYSDQPIEPELISDLVLAAIQAPSAVNVQPWTFTVLRDRDLLDRVSIAAKAHMLSTLAGHPNAERFQAHLGHPDFQIFYHAPALVLISANSEGPWIVEDCAMAAQNLMLAAYAAGLGSCWIGFAQSFLNTPEGKEMLKIPAEWAPVAPIILGYPKAFPAPVARKPAEIRWID
jgi:nitroreductase